MIRFGIIGIGSMGFAHAKALAAGEINGAGLASVADINPARLKLAQENWPGVACFSDASSLLAAGGVDAVLIATPHPFHTEIATLALEQGIPVLSEKPADIVWEKAVAAQSVAERTGFPYAMMFNQRNNPVYRKLKSMIASGELGNIKRVNWTVTNWYRTDAYYASGAWRGTWKGEGGGVLLNQAPHNLDMINWLFGCPESVYARCAYGKYHPSVDVEDDAVLVMSYPGFNLIFSTSTGECPGTNRMEIACDMGKVIVEKGVITFYRLSENERVICATSPERHPHPVVTEERVEAPGEDTAHQGILQNFTDHLTAGVPLTATIADGINEIMLSNAAYLSAWTGEEVALPLEDERFASLLAQRREKDERDISAHPDGETGGYSDRWMVKW